ARAAGLAALPHGRDVLRHRRIGGLQLLGARTACDRRDEHLAGAVTAEVAVELSSECHGSPSRCAAPPVREAALRRERAPPHGCSIANTAAGRRRLLDRSIDTEREEDAAQPAASRATGPVARSRSTLISRITPLGMMWKSLCR